MKVKEVIDLTIGDHLHQYYQVRTHFCLVFKVLILFEMDSQLLYQKHNIQEHDIDLQSVLTHPNESTMSKLYKAQEAQIVLQEF